MEHKKDNTEKQKGKQKVRKLPEHLWKKGQSGNPGGRPKKKNCYADIVREMLSANEIVVSFIVVDSKTGEEKEKKLHIKTDVNFYYQITAAQITEAMKGDCKAYNALLDRGHGKPPQSIDHTLNNEKDEADNLTKNEELAVYKALMEIESNSDDGGKSKSD